MDASIHRTQVDLSGLMRVLGQHLYSTPNVVVRELIQNAHDSCVRRAAADPEPPTPLIRVTADHEGGRLHVEDNGAGLTAEEIERYLAVIGRGQTGESREEGVEGLIGLFGLGFLSAYVVAEATEVWTASHRTPDECWRFTSRSGQTFTIEPGAARPVGTRVTLTLKPGHRDLARPSVLSALVRRFCCLLPIEVELTHARGEDARVGASTPPWRAPERSPLRRRALSLEFARRFEAGFEPLCTLPIEGDELVGGTLWIQDGSSYGNADNRRVSLFVRGMLITDDARWLLPDWATFMGAVIESDALAPTASREDVQRDAVFDRVRAAIARALLRGLGELSSREPATWRRVLRRHNEALLGASLCDPRLFELVADQLTVPTSMGDLHAQVVLRRAGGTIHVSQAQRSGVEALMFRARAIPVVRGTRYGALAFCREFTRARGGGLHIIGEREDPALLG
ncbi:MAG: ATP-binding protein, partial [Myxococcales bacterium]|nr:ATP-binding protein [Myxococcales bacterium]